MLEITKDKNNHLLKKKKIVIKIGSSLLVSNDKIRKKWLENFVENVAKLINKNFEIVIVSSGAIALGKSHINNKQKTLSLPEKQASAAIGQISLMSHYKEIFIKNKIQVAQILLTASDCNNKNRYINCKNTIETLLKNKIIPIINENDSVAVEEIKIGDNDRLAARVSQMISADLLILFSDIDGLYDKNPKIYKNAKFIDQVFDINQSIENMAQGSSSDVGTGGMITKIMAAKMLKNSSCDVVISNGLELNSIEKLFFDKKKFTIFYNNSNVDDHKTWLSGILNVCGKITIDKNFVNVLKTKKDNLLSRMIIDVEGNFKSGDVVNVSTENGKDIANAICNYNSKQLKKIINELSLSKTRKEKEYIVANKKDILML